LRKLKQRVKDRSRDEVLSKVLLGGFIDSLSGSALARFLNFSEAVEEAGDTLSPDTFDDAI